MIKKMTLDQAIEHYDSFKDTHYESAVHYRQLAEWLKELKERRMEDKVNEKGPTRKSGRGKK